MSSITPHHFIWKILLWLPLSFAVWYYMAPTIAIPVSFGTDLLLSKLFPTLLAAVESKGYYFDVVTHLAPNTALNTQPSSAAQGHLVFSINPLVYAYCIPLYTALILATPGEEFAKWMRWSIGILVLILTQIWGVSFEILKTILFELNSEAQTKVIFTNTQAELVAISYQFGFLILPAVTPIILWIALNQQFIRSLAPTFTQKSA